VFLTLVFFWLFISLVVWFVTYLVLNLYFEQNPVANAEELKEQISRGVFFTAPFVFGLIIFWKSKKPEDEIEEDETEEEELE
jgi:membrane protein DedA with SNARE-associated domain